MKKSAGFLIIALIIISIIAFPARAEEKSDEICIIFTSDMHSHFDTETINRDGRSEKKGGFAKVKTIIDEAKAQNPNTIVLDCGDFSMGTLYQTLFSAEAPELNLMHMMGYDAITLGNHEFDYRAEGLADMLNASIKNNTTIPMVISNINWDETLADKNLEKDATELKGAMDNYGVKDYVILNKNGLKVAVFGILGNDAISYAPKSGLIFADPIKSAKGTVKKIKESENPDLIICLSHSGTKEDKNKSEDEKLAKKVPDIDVIISGHTHTVLDKPIIIGKTIICSVGSYTYYTGSLTLKKNNDEDFSIKKYSLIPVDETVKDNIAILEKINKYRKLVDNKYLSLFDYKFDEVLSHSSFAFTPIENFEIKLGEDGLGNLISDSYIYAVKQAEGENYEPIDVSIVPSGVIRASFDEGAITVAEVYNVSSLGIGKDKIPGYPLVSIYLTGKELISVAEVDASISRIMPEAQLFISGLQYKYNPNRLFLNRVTDVYLVKDNKVADIDKDRLYRVVSELYSAQMLGAVKAKSFGLLSIIPKDKAGNEIINFEDHIIYTKDNKELKEWAALASYINSFSQNSYASVPEYYNQTHNKKIKVDSKNIGELIKKPNKVFAVFVLFICAVLFIIILSVKKIRKALKRRKKRKAVS